MVDKNGDMKMMYNVAIIGAGPAGIFTAIEMLRLGSKKKIVMFVQMMMFILCLKTILVLLLI